MQKVLIRNEEVIYKNIIYDKKCIRDLDKELKKKVTFVLLNKLEVKDAHIEDNDSEDFLLDDDILTHIVLNKKIKRKFKYSIKGGIVLKNLISNRSFIKVKPVQFIIKKSMKKFMKDKKKYRGIISLFDKIYITDFEDNNIIKSDVISIEEFAENKELFLKGNLILDKSVKEIINNEENRYFDIKKEVEKELYGIQKLFTKGICRKKEKK